MSKAGSTLDELAYVVRSKNAGPFMTTCDIFFETKHNYDTVKRTNRITKEAVAELYGIDIDDIVGIFYHDNALGIKITFLKPKRASVGDVLCTDIYGAQQFVPLLNLEI